MTTAAKKIIFLDLWFCEMCYIVYLSFFFFEARAQQLMPELEIFSIRNSRQCTPVFTLIHVYLCLSAIVHMSNEILMFPIAETNYSFADK